MLVSILFDARYNVDAISCPRLLKTAIGMIPVFWLIPLQDRLLSVNPKPSRISAPDGKKLKK